MDDKQHDSYPTILFLNAQGQPRVEVLQANCDVGWEYHSSRHAEK